MKNLVLLRHGESIRNKENRFTGWSDVPLSQDGQEEARYAGKLLAAHGFSFDIGYTSVLHRAIKSLWLVLEYNNLSWIPVVCDWRLNERHYGALQGLDKGETARLHGEEQVHQWRRSYAVRPPPLQRHDLRWPGDDPRYLNLGLEQIPLTESLEDTLQRVVCCWEERIVPELRSDRRIIISAHGNSLRALVKYLDRISDDEVENLNIPTGIPLVYEFDDHLSVRRHYYLEKRNHRF